MWDDIQIYNNVVFLLMLVYSWQRTHIKFYKKMHVHFTWTFSFNFYHFIAFVGIDVQLNRCTHEHTFVWHGPEALGPVSSESALRGLTWAATCLGRADWTEAPTTSHLFLSRYFLPSPPHICTVLLQGRTHTHTHTFMSLGKTYAHMGKRSLH